MESHAVIKWLKHICTCCCIYDTPDTKCFICNVKLRNEQSQYTIECVRERILDITLRRNYFCIWVIAKTA